MKKIIRLTEKDLTRIVKRVIKESEFDFEQDEKDQQDYDNYRENFLYDLNFDYESAFGDDMDAEMRFIDELETYIADVYGFGESVEEAIKGLRREPFFRKVRKHLRK